MTTEKTHEPVDRTGWPAGPWDNEPDMAEFRHAGLACLIRRGAGGAWCGYVALPPGHPWRDVEDYDIPASVHGGITLGPQACYGEICHVPEPGESEDVRWIGFDCSHCDDIAPGDLGHGPSISAMFGRRAMYRDMAYARAETERLAEQAAEASR